MERNLAVLTSGGDAPGMNAAIRAVVRSSLSRDWRVYGIESGFEGLLGEQFRQLGGEDVSGTIGLGGTFLRSSRSSEFREEHAQSRAAAILHARHIMGLVVIGGDGSQAGALALRHKGIAVVGIPATIDNDVFGTDLALGVDTALNVSLEAIDRIKVTAASSRRAFLVEVMGRNSGYLALVSGIAGGAELIVIPEAERDPAEMTERLLGSYQRGHTHAIAVVAEGARGGLDTLASHILASPNYTGYELRATKLGYVQRGGTPGVTDRLLASGFGVAACECLARGEHGVMVGRRAGKIVFMPLEEVAASRKVLDPELVQLSEHLMDDMEGPHLP